MVECRRTPCLTIWAPEGRGEQSSFGRNSRVRRQTVSAVDERKRSYASSTVAPQEYILSVQNPVWILYGLFVFLHLLGRRKRGSEKPPNRRGVACRSKACKSDIKQKKGKRQNRRKHTLQQQKRNIKYVFCKNNQIHK